MLSENKKGWENKLTWWERTSGVLDAIVELSHGDSDDASEGKECNDWGLHFGFFWKKVNKKD